MSINIMVVDDEQDLELLIRQKFRKKIQNNEYVFHFARDGVDALEKLENISDLDLVLADINMPRMDGLTLLSKINELNQIFRVIIVSAYGDMKNIRVAMNRGAFDFLTKPIDFNDLEITIDKTFSYVIELKDATKKREELISIQRELDFAKKIQTRILPDKIPDVKGIDIAARYVPMMEIGGDLYDFHVVDDQSLGVIMIDVSGHGVSAALIGAMVKISFSIQHPEASHPDKLLKGMNSILFGKLGDQFLTASYIYLDLKNKKLFHSNGAHLPLLILKKESQKIVELKPKGKILGWFEDVYLDVDEFTLEIGDRIILHTDGLTECANPEMEIFGEERFFSAILENQHLNPDDFIDSLFKELEEWTGIKEGYEDDLTIIVIDIVE